MVIGPRRRDAVAGPVDQLVRPMWLGRKDYDETRAANLHDGTGSDARCDDVCARKMARPTYRASSDNRRVRRVRRNRGWHNSDDLVSVKPNAGVTCASKASKLMSIP